MPAVIVTCPSCGRRGKAAAPGRPVRCGECGKELKAGDRGSDPAMDGIRAAMVFHVAAAVADKLDGALADGDEKSFSFDAEDGVYTV